MYLKLSPGCFSVMLKIPRSTDDYYDVYMTVEDKPGINLLTVNCNLFYGEILDLLGDLKSLLSDKNFQSKQIEFFDPDFDFILESESKSVQMRLYFWDGCPTENYLSLKLYEKDIKNLIIYLEVVLNIVKKNDNQVADLIRDGVIITYI